MATSVELVAVEHTAFFCDRMSLQVFTMVGAIAAMQAVTISSTSGVREGLLFLKRCQQIWLLASRWTHYVSFFSL